MLELSGRGPALTVFVLWHSVLMNIEMFTAVGGLMWRLSGRWWKHTERSSYCNLYVVRAAYDVIFKWWFFTVCNVLSAVLYLTPLSIKKHSGVLYTLTAYTRHSVLKGQASTCTKYIRLILVQPPTCSHTDTDGYIFMLSLGNRAMCNYTSIYTILSWGSVQFTSWTMFTLHKHFSIMCNIIHFPIMSKSGTLNLHFIMICSIKAVST